MIDKTGKIIWFTKFNKLLKTPVKIIDSNFILLFGDTIKSISSNNGKELWSISIQESESESESEYESAALTKRNPKQKKV